ncbi:MAG: hypothetical protein AAFY35_07055 [Pseudomonadota bacterium]
MVASKPTYGFLVAENHDLARVFNGSESASAELLSETLPANVFVNVAQVTSHNLTVSRRSGRKYISDPFFRIKRAMVSHHGPIVDFHG